MSTYRELEQRVIYWAKQKGILDKGNPATQAAKTDEEVFELRVAIAENNMDEIKDALGDILVTMIIQAKMQDVDLLDCLEGALNIIEKRTGKMINGTFVKDND